MKICIIYNFAQHYRAGIFKKLSENYDCDFVFGKNTTDIKTMDYTVLKGSVREVRVLRKGPLEYQCGVPSLAFKGYDAIIILIDPKGISCWLLLLFCRLFSKTKIYGWTHGWYGKETKWRSLIKKANYKLANGIFLYGNYAKELMVKEGFDKDKLFVVHNSLDYDYQVKIRQTLAPKPVYKDYFKNDNKNLLFIGRLTPVKQLGMLVEALARLNSIKQKYNLTFIGGGTERERLKELVRMNNLEKNVWFYGPCFDEKTNAELIFNSDLCVSPGNVGLTAMHTMVFGTPVITHNNFPYQMPEFESIKEDETGAFFEQNDINSLVETIEKWFQTHPNREEIRQKCFNQIDEYWTPKFQMEVFDSVLNKM